MTDIHDAANLQVSKALEHIKKLLPKLRKDPEQLQYINDTAADYIQDTDPRVYISILGQMKSKELLKVMSSMSDSRTAYFRSVIDRPFAFDL